MYFLFILLTSFTGFVLATIIRIELATPGVSILNNDSEKYLTIAALHAIVMVFFVVIPLIFGAFGNFLLPTQLGVRDVAFPRLNSFMFWVTPSGFVLLLHILLFDKLPSESFDQNFEDQLRYNFVYNLSLKLNEINNDIFTMITSLVDYRRDDISQLVDFIKTLSIFFFDFILNLKSNIQNIFLSIDFELLSNFDFLPKHYTIINTILDYYYSVRLSVEDHTKKIVAVENKLQDELVLFFAPVKSSFSHNIFGFRRENVLFNHALIKNRFSYFINNTSSDSIFMSAFFDSFCSLRRSMIKVSDIISSQVIPGWAFITPYTSRLRFTSVGKVDIALVVIFMAGLGSLFSAVNYIITYRCVSAPSFKNRKELRSFFVDGLLVGSRMMVAANPALLIAILFLLSDRHLGTSIFDFSGGGDAVLFQHLFWFFGHPEVYIIIIPCFGIVNSLLPHLLRKRLSGRLSLQYSMYTIGFMAFAVWGHHMYMVGLANTTRTLYSTMTVMISVPASTKVLHWCVTLINSSPQFDVSLLFLLSFTYFFTLGGLSGMFNAHIGFDVSLHDTFFVIGHFHVMLAGAAFSCIFAAFYFYFSAIFGVCYSRFWAITHFLFYFFGQLFTVIPMFWLGYSGMPRRIMDYPAFFGGWHSIISGGHFLSVLSFISFIIMLIESYWESESPLNRTLGVSRLNTRFSFYLYERQKFEFSRKFSSNSQISSNNDFLRSVSNKDKTRSSFLLL